MSSEFDPLESGNYDAQFEIYKTVFSEVFNEVGLSIDDVLNKEDALAKVSEQVRERLGIDSVDDLDIDSLMVLELIESLEDGGDDGLAGDREPRVVPPTPDIGSIALNLE